MKILRCLVFMFALCLFTFSTSTAKAAENLSNLPPDGAQAYLDVLEQLDSQYGKVRMVADPSYTDAKQLRGFLWTDLVDFDGDKIPELIYVVDDGSVKESTYRSIPQQYVLAYHNGSVIDLHAPKNVNCLEPHPFPKVQLLIGDDKAYLASDQLFPYEGGETSGTAYYTKNGTSMQRVLYFIQWLPSMPIILNGNEVTENVLDTALSNLWDGCTFKSQDLSDSASPSELTSSINKTLASLRQRAGSSGTSTSVGFRDVPAGEWYNDAVQWAVEKGITTGMSSTRFAPSEPCTNAQILTFIWRAEGKPTPAPGRFANVSSNDYYYQAALWAKGKAMVYGDTFPADTPCTRGMTVNYLWKAAGRPNTSTTSRYKDVPANSDYFKAVSWAVNKGITSGVSSSSFAPNQTCTRAQIATFLYRAYH